MAAAYAGTSSSMATATTGLLPRVQANQSSRFLALPYLPPRTSTSSLRILSNNLSGMFFEAFCRTPG